MSEEKKEDTDDDLTPPPAERKVRRALTEIRREGWKVAAIYAVVDATLVALIVNFIATVVHVPVLPQRIQLPPVTLDALETVGVAPADPTIATSAILGIIIGGIVLTVEVGWRIRQPLVEQFENANPDLHEALRTARDTVEKDTRSRIALRLYTDVLDELKRASSIGLIDLKRVTATILVIALLSVATIQLSVVDISLAGNNRSPDAELEDGTEPAYSGLQDGSSILGDPEDVPAGEEELNATVDTSGSGSGDGVNDDLAAVYNTGGFDDSTTIDTQRAGFSERENLEDAALIREYNLRIREANGET